jgi:transcriptional regulator with XRE-family HTH domain|nr:MAG: helix-turn-helix domain protein [Bacteriophage sp.]
MSFYEKYLMLCDKNKKTPSGAALEMGLSKTTVNRWKNGGGITDATILKVASYFGIPKEELTGEEQKEKPTPGEGSGLDADVKAKAYTILDKLSKLPTKQQEAFLNSLDISIDAALNMMDGNGNG